MKKTALIVGLLSLAFVDRADAQPRTAVTDHHKILQKDVGVWNVKMKLWPEGPDGPVVEGVGVERNRALGNGLWILSNFKGSFGGTAYEGHGTFGYNTHKEKYVGTWVDSMNSAMSRMEGTYDQKTKTLTLHAEGTDPNGKTMKSKNVSKYIDDNNRVFTMSRRVPDTEDKYVKMMELQYTRKEK